MEEGFSINTPPLFREIKYDYWKECMIAHFEFIHIDLWDVLNKIPKGQRMKEKKLKFLLNSKVRNVMIRIHQGTQLQKCQINKCETLAITYDGMSQVKRNKLSLLTPRYELFSMKEGKDIQCMFGLFQTILNERRSLGRTYDNYDHIDKILRSLSRKWRPQVTTLRDLKNLDSMSLEELVATRWNQKRSLWSSAVKGTKRRHCPENKYRKADDSFDDEYEEDSDKDELTFISQKIRKMWQNKGSSKWKTPQEEYPKKRKIKTRAPYSTMNAKKPRHLKSECLELEKGQEKKKYFKTKEKQGLMNMDDTSSDEDDKQANICLMANTTFDEFESD
ncbi:hypothetical protein HKD37_05G012991 [Glycine soja]